MLDRELGSFYILRFSFNSTSLVFKEEKRVQKKKENVSNADTVK